MQGGLLVGASGALNPYLGWRSGALAARARCAQWRQNGRCQLLASRSSSSACGRFLATAAIATAAYNTTPEGSEHGSETPLWAFSWDSQLSLHLSGSDQSPSSRMRVDRRLGFRGHLRQTDEDLSLPKVSVLGYIPAPHGRATH